MCYVRTYDLCDFTLNTHVCIYAYMYVHAYSSSFVHIVRLGIALYPHSYTVSMCSCYWSVLPLMHTSKIQRWLPHSSHPIIHVHILLCIHAYTSGFVHNSEMSTYCIRFKFRGVKLSRFSRISSHPRKFHPVRIYTRQATVLR